MLALMKEHAKILKPKFDMVIETLEREIAPLGIAKLARPRAAISFSVNTAPGLLSVRRRSPRRRAL